MTVVSIVPAPPTEAMLWDDVKNALIKIGDAEDDILGQWVIVGARLTQIRKENPGYRGGPFAGAAKRYLAGHGLTLTANQMSSAQWWAQLPQEWRDKLHNDAPDSLAPTRLQDICRDKYPDRSKIKEAHTSLAKGSKKKPQNKNKSPVIADPEDKDDDAEDDDLPDTPAPPAAKPPSLKRQKEIAEEMFREHLRQERAARATKEQERAAKDTRPRCKAPDTSILMFGVQIWPVTDADKVRLGHYDYDQLFFGLHQFYAWYDLVPTVHDHVSRAITLRQRLKHFRMFVERRLSAGPDKVEATRFVDVVDMLTDLYKADPGGKCSPRPIDPCIR